MSRCLPFAALSAVLFAAIACSSTPPADQPTNASGSTSEESSGPDQGSGEVSDPGEPTTQAEMGSVKKSEGADNTIPDDYTMLRGDCQMLGQKLGAVTRADYMAQIPEKITDEKRAATEENINNVATKLGEQWTRMCMDSLVDKVVERERMKCAMESRTAKKFEECINPPEPKK
jgi:hypothetical protein